MSLTRVQSCMYGLRSGFPLAASSGFLGLLYGATCASLGVSALPAVLASALVFSGAVQFAILGLLDEPLAWGAIAVSSFLVCNRFVLMGASIAEHLRGAPFPARVLAMQALTDGSWAATIAEKRDVNRFWYFVSAGLSILLLWVAGTLIGVASAELIDANYITSLRFSGVLFLVLLLLLVVRNTQIRHLPWIAATLSSLVASLLLPLAIAFILGVVVGGSIAWHQSEEPEHDDG